MSNETKERLEKMADVLKGLTPEQTDRVLDRGTAFMAGAAFRELSEERRRKQREHEREKIHASS